MNANETKLGDAKAGRLPVAEIVWAVLSIGSLGLLLRCLAC
jgi:hypothetical protein